MSDTDTGKATTKPGSTAEGVSVDGACAEVIAAGATYSLINRTKDLTWPNEALRKLAGVDDPAMLDEEIKELEKVGSRWGAWRPKNGDVGNVVHVWTRPPDGKIYLLRIDQHYAAIGASGVRVGDEEPEARKEESEIRQCNSCQAQYESKYTHCPTCGREDSSAVERTRAAASSYMEFLHEQGKMRDVFNTGVRAFLDGKFAEAEQAYKRTLELFPKDATVHGNMGHLLLAQGKIDAAIPWLEKALELNPLPAGMALRQLFTVEDTLKLEDALERLRTVEGIPEMLDHAKDLLGRKQTVLTGEDIERLKARRRGRSAPIDLIEKDKKTTLRTAMGTFTCTYEKHKAKTAADALDFLSNMNVATQFHYVEVETPDGLIGKDINGLYKL